MNENEIKETLAALPGGRVDFYQDGEQDPETVLLGTVSTDAEVTDSHELIFDFQTGDRASLRVSCEGFCTTEHCTAAGIQSQHADWHTITSLISATVHRLEH